MVTALLLGMVTVGYSMALNIQARITDNIRVEIIPAPDIICVSCKQVIGKYLGKGKAIDKLGIRLPGKCPLCSRNWLACIDGDVTIKTKEGLINVK